MSSTNNFVSVSVSSSTKIYTKTLLAEQLPSIGDIITEYCSYYQGPIASCQQIISFLACQLTAGKSIIIGAFAEEPSQPKQPKPVGLLICHQYQSTIQATSTWLLNDLYVYPNWRRKKVASTLIHNLEQTLKAQKSNHILLITESNNSTAIALYRNMGWQLGNHQIWQRIISN